MSEPSQLDGSLGQLVNALRQPVSIAPGLARRVRARSRRRRSAQIAGGTAATTLGALAVALLVRTPGRNVTFAITAPTGHSVALVGDFTDWRSDRVQLARDAGGEWHATVKLRPGRYRFAYVVDRGEWRADSHAASAPDDFGRPTSVVTVAEN